MKTMNYLDKKIKDEELLELVVEIKKGNVAAKNQIITENLKLIQKCVSEIKNSELDFEDLVQEAVIILLQKLDNFDPSKASLATFIWSNVKLPLLNSTQKMPVRVYKESQKIKKAEAYLSECGKTVSAENTAEIIGSTAAKINKIKSITNQFNYLYFDQQISQDEDSETLGSHYTSPDYLSPEENFFENLQKSKLSQALEQISPKQRQILTLHYNLDNSTEGPLSLREISKILGTSHQNLSYQEQAAFKIIRNFFQTSDFSI